jgi:hypothetical protein
MSDRMPSAYVDNPNITTLLVDTTVALQMMNGLVRLTFGQWHTDYSEARLPPVKCVCVAKMAMTMDQAEYTARELLSFVTQQRMLLAVPEASLSSSIN